MEQLKNQKPVQLSPEYHQKLRVYASIVGKSHKKAIEDLLDLAIDLNLPKQPIKLSLSLQE